MKKVTLLITLMITSLGFSQTYLPFTFTNGDQLMTGLNGSVGSLVPDPLDGANQVLQIVGAGAEYDLVLLNLSTVLNLQDNANNTITFRMNPIGATGVHTHALKFEVPGAVEQVFTTTGSGWQNITVDFPAGLVAYSRIIIFTDFANTDNGTYLVDDIMGATNNPLSGGVTLPLNFSSTDQLFSPGDVTLSLIADPNDETNQVMQVDGSIAASFNQGNLSLNPGVNLSDDANNTISIRINPIGITGVRQHLLKFENGGAAPNAEVWFSTTDSGWQTITLDYGVDLGTYSKIVFFPDAGSPDNEYTNLNTGTYLVDDIKFASALSIAKFDKASMKMYPNPMKNTLTIDANSSIQRVSLYNVLGQEVMKASPKSNTITLQTNELQKGVYMVETEIDGKISTSKVLKQ